MVEMGDMEMAEKISNNHWSYLSKIRKNISSKAPVQFKYVSDLTEGKYSGRLILHYNDVENDELKRRMEKEYGDNGDKAFRSIKEEVDSGRVRNGLFDRENNDYPYIIFIGDKKGDVYSAVRISENKFIKNGRVVIYPTTKTTVNGARIRGIMNIRETAFPGI